MADASPPEQAKVAPSVPPEAEVKPQQPEAVKAPQLQSAAEKIDVSTTGLKKNEENTIKQADAKTKTALARLEILKNVSVG